MSTCKFMKKTLSHILYHVFAFIFSECITITSSEEGESVRAQLFSGNTRVVLLVIYLLFWFIQVNFLHIAFDVPLTIVFVK